MVFGRKSEVYMDYLTMDENVCPVCGKVFLTVIGRDWGWTYKGSKYCTYHCMRHVEVRYRVRKGWEDTPYGRRTEELGKQAKRAYKSLMRMRALRKAYLEMGQTTDGEDKALKTLVKRIGELGDAALSEWAPRMDKLDEGKRKLAAALFVDGKSVEEVARDLDIDTDLMWVKINLVCEALAGEKDVEQ